MPPTIPPPVTRIVQRTDLACLHCGRSSGYLQERAIHPDPNADPILAARLVCTWCGGRLIEGETVEVYQLRPLTPEEHGDEPKRGRPARGVTG